MANEIRDRLVESMAKRFKELYKDGDWNFNEMLVGVADYLLDDGWVRPPCRCKDCKFYEPYNKPVEDFDGYCIARDCETDEMDYCNYGQMRNNNG